jgi:hypothetical protein
MANICVLEIELSFADSEDAKAFAESFEVELKKANENQKGIYIGSERYLFEAEIDAPVNNKLLMNGWVKWALSQEEAVKFIAFINGFCELVEAIIYYEETSDCIYGKFIYQDCVLEDNFIPANHKIWDKNREDDDYDHELEKALELGGITQIIN